MDTIKLLIADDNEGIRNSMEDYFRRQEGVTVVATASNGADAFEATLLHKPDVVVLDLVMPIHDGFVYLDKLAGYQGAKPRVIVLSAMGKDDTIARAIDMGASFYMLKPFDFGVLHQRVNMLRGLSTAERPAGNWPQPAPSAVKRDVTERINELFLGIGIPSHVKGYDFLKEAVHLVAENWETIHYITKELYPAVARTFDTSPSKVERSIRHAISITWQRNNLENFRAMLGIPAHEAARKPSNGEFIALVADKVRLSKTA